MHFILEAIIDVFSLATCLYMALSIITSTPLAVLAYKRHKCPYIVLLSALFPIIPFGLFVIISGSLHDAGLSAILFFILHITTLFVAFGLSYFFYKTVFEGERLRDVLKKAAKLVLFGKSNTVSFFNIFSFGVAISVFDALSGSLPHDLFSFLASLWSACSLAVLVYSLTVCSFMSGYYTLFSEASENIPGTVYLNGEGLLVQEDGSHCNRFVSVAVTFLAGVLFFFSALFGKKVDGFSMTPKEKETTQPESSAK